MKSLLVNGQILAGLLGLVLLPASGHAFAQSAPIAVEPGDLDRRGDLVGKVVTVDDRVRFYQFHTGQGYDELYLKRTSVVFRLPPSLRPEGSPRPLPVVVQGTLSRDGGQLVCRVTALKVFPSDLQRLDQALAALPEKDLESRKAWADWAEKRGKDFKDNALIQRARSIQAEVLRREAAQKRVTVDTPGEWLAMAEDARRRKLPEPVPSVLAHKAFRARLAAARTSEAVKEVVAAIERFFPQAAKDQDAGRIILGRWDQAYAHDGADAAPAPPADIRRALDRRLWADAVQQLLETQAAEDPHMAIRLVPRAEAELPERPELAKRLLIKSLEEAQQNLGMVRLAEVKEMAWNYREKLQNPRAAVELYRNWLKVRRDRLSPTDAEGPVALAALYEELLQDRSTARELLERAWKIDPGSKEVVEAFRSRGYRRVKDGWVEEAPTTASGESAPSAAGAVATPPRPVSAQGLRGMTPEEVAQQVRSKPDRKVLSGTRGQLIEQWIFRVPNQNQVRYINFLHSQGDQPRVIADYFLPGSVIRGELKPPR